MFNLDTLLTDFPHPVLKYEAPNFFTHQAEHEHYMNRLQVGLLGLFIFNHILPVTVHPKAWMKISENFAPFQKS